METGFLTAANLLGVLVAVALVAVGFWIREKRLRAQRYSAGVLHSLSEDIIAASSPAAIAEKLSSVLPKITTATSASLYLFDRRSKCLERVVTTSDPDPMVIPLDAPPEGLANAIVVCYRNHEQLPIPDVRRNPLIKVGAKLSLPKSALLVPLISQQETLGVIQAENTKRVGYFSPEEIAAIQHVANQTTASLKLQEQQRIREQLFHSEKLAATGQLISGVAGDLSAPLERITRLAASLAILDKGSQSQMRELAEEAQRASEIVARLVSFTPHTNASPQPIDVNAIVAGLIRFREPEWKSHDLRVQHREGTEPALVSGIEGQIGQVFLNLLVHAEQNAAESSAKTISIKTSKLAGRVLVEIDYASPNDEEQESRELASNLEVCRGIMRTHNGEIRFRRRSGTCGFEAELPLIAKIAEPLRVNSAINQDVRSLTLMLVDSDPHAQKQLLIPLGERGHRVVPVAAEGAVDMAQRLRFDAVLWAMRTGGSGWCDFHDRISDSIPAFVLISNGYDQELAGSLEASGGFLLSRPLQEAALDRILQQIDLRAARV